MITTAYGTPTNVETTVTVTANVTCVPSTLLTAGEAVLVEVLSGSVLYTIHDSGATPDHNDYVLTTGDQMLLKPAGWLRMRRNGDDACVKMQAFQV